jgi:hypothetical protein
MRRTPNELAITASAASSADPGDLNLRQAVAALASPAPEVGINAAVTWTLRVTALRSALVSGG